MLGWDPAFRTGCKLAVVDPTGKVLDTTVVYPTAPTNETKIRQAKETLKKLSVLRGRVSANAGLKPYYSVRILPGQNVLDALEDTLKTLQV